MKQIYTNMLIWILPFIALVALSGCGSSGIPSKDTLVGSVPPPSQVALPPQVTLPYAITSHQGSTAVVHAHVTTVPTNGTTHTHQWTQTAGPTVTLNTPTATTTTFITPSSNTHSIVLQHTVTTPQTGQTTVTSHTIVPIPASTNLAVTVSQPATIMSGDSSSLHASASGGDGNYTYTWLQTAGTNVTLDITYPSAPTFTAPNVSSDETLIFSVEVKDGSGALVSTTELITVTPAVQALQITASVPTDVSEGSTFALNTQASGGTAPYTYKWENAVNAFGSIADDTLQHATFTTDYIDNTSPSAPTILGLQFTVTVTDAKGASVTSNAHNVKIHDVPVTVTITGATTVKAGDPVKLTALGYGGNNGPYIYEWYDILADPINPILPLSPILEIPGIQTAAIPPGTTLPYEVKVKNTINGIIETITQSVLITITPVANHNGTEYGTVVSPHTGKIWLDRNLGAAQVCTSFNDTSCYGDYYQWGRNFDGHEDSNSGTTVVQSANVNDVGHGNFIITHNDWASTDTAGDTRSANWSKTDGSFVCPAGFRVPTTTELEAERSGANIQNRDAAFNSFLKLPSSGHRDNGNNALMDGVGIWGNVWASNSLSGIFSSSSLFWDSTSSSIDNNTAPALGVAVRCIGN